jgi:hypothetical protein
VGQNSAGPSARISASLPTGGSGLEILVILFEVFVGGDSYSIQLPTGHWSGKALALAILP